MFASIVSYGLAVGAVYALIGITYNVMFSASRVFSFTAGMLGMLGGVLGALFIAKWGLPSIVGLVLVLVCGGVLALRLLQQDANFLVRGIFAAVAVFVVFIILLPLRTKGLDYASTATHV